MTRRSLRAAGIGAALVLMAFAGLAAGVWWLNIRGETPVHRGRQIPGPIDATLVAKGAYLAKAGNCAACHTARGGEGMSGGRGIDTPFGALYTSNLTPDRDTGIGDWSADEFWRAMHHGRSKSGRLLYPAFPYPSYTLVTRADSDALYAYLQSLPPVRRENKPHELGFPYNLQASLAVWRALYFRPAVHEDEPGRTAQWNRGRYLVRGMGHCVACHSTRNALGAITGDVELGGGLIPMQNWYAPSLASDKEASVAHWRTEDVVALLRTGVSPQASVLGPMAEVVYRSTQYLNDGDLRAMAVYLQALPQAKAPAHEGPADVAVADASILQKGARLYGEHCAACHGEKGQGVAKIYPALAGNRAVMHPAANNLVKVITQGGFAPTTAGNPRPFGMPPFAQVLSEDDVAAVTTYIRQAWGNRAAPVSNLDVLRARSF
jgi:mono/diheme cytochrome c family protein